MSICPFRFTKLLAAAAFAAVAFLPAAAQDSLKQDHIKLAPQSLRCAAPGELTRLSASLSRITKKIVTGDAIKIVAIGSSSTAGAGASSPDHSYPSRLAVELTSLFPKQQFAVVNRGINGEVTRDMLARFDTDVFSENPDLVIWQVGSNAVLRDQPLMPAGQLIHDGIGRLKAAGVDVILLDPQFAPKVLAKPDADGMVDLIAVTAKKENVGLFRRFAVMRHWRQTEHIPYEAFLSPDELHMNDWSYGCLAKLMAGAIAETATRSTLTASTGTAR